MDKKNYIKLLKLQIDSNYILLLIFLSIFSIFLIFRNSSFPPFIMADEYHYSKWARLMQIGESPDNNYIYLFLFSVTKYFTDGFLEICRLINVFFYTTGLFFIFLISKKILSPVFSIYITIISAFLGINIYTVFFMPESLYFCVFYIFTWIVISLELYSKYIKWFISGIVLGFLALVKPHAIVIIPIIFILCNYLYLSTTKKNIYRLINTFFIFLCGFSLIKFGLSYLIAGNNAFKLVGKRYSYDICWQEEIISIIKGISINFTGNIIFNSIIWGLPLFIAIDSVCKIFNSDYCPYNVDRCKFDITISIYTLLCFILLMSMSSIFMGTIGSIVNTSQYESIYRISLRYYNFIFPMFFIIIGAALEHHHYHNSKANVVIQLIIFLFTLYALLYHLRPFTPTLADSPDIYALSVENNYLFCSIIALSLLTIVICFFSRVFAIKLYLFVFIPFFCMNTNYILASEVLPANTDSQYDEAGKLGKIYFDNQNSKIILVGHPVDEAGLYRTLFYFDNIDVQIDIIPEEELFDIDKYKDYNQFIVFSKKIQKIQTIDKVILPYFALVKRELTINFSELNNLQYNITGLSGQEAWGRWSDAKEVRFEFSRPLPQNFDLCLTAAAFGSNIGKDFIINIGSQQVLFQLVADPVKQCFRFSNNLNNSSFNIIVPEPVSPKELGMNDDPRKIGIGFYDLKITSVQ